MSTTYTIPAKSSNSGSIHDIESEHGERKVRFAAGCMYAVVRASYYGGKGYTTHTTKALAAKASRALGDYSHQIIDADGNTYRVHRDWDCYTLIADDIRVQMRDRQAADALTKYIYSPGTYEVARSGQLMADGSIRVDLLCTVKNDGLRDMTFCVAEMVRPEHAALMAAALTASNVPLRAT